MITIFRDMLGPPFAGSPFAAQLPVRQILRFALAVTGIVEPNMSTAVASAGSNYKNDSF
jgi:hypothetical protein